MQELNHKDTTEENAKKLGHPCWMCEYGCDLWDDGTHWEHCKKCMKAAFNAKPSEFTLKGKDKERRLPEEECNAYI